MVSKINGNINRWKSRLNLFRIDMIKIIKRFCGKWITTWSWLSMSMITNFPSRHVRMILLRMKGANIAKHVSIWRGVEIRNPKGLIIEEGCAIGPGVTLDARKGLYIGRNVTIAKMQ